VDRDSQLIRALKSEWIVSNAVEGKPRVKPEGFFVKDLQEAGLSCFGSECLAERVLEPADIRRCFSQGDFYQYFCWFSVDELNMICADVIDIEVEVKNTPTSIECDAGPCHYTVKFLGNVSSGMIRRIRSTLLALLTDDRLIDFSSMPPDKDC
jgi:hypothetical protein